MQNRQVAKAKKTGIDFTTKVKSMYNKLIAYIFNDMLMFQTN